ncbi:MAG: hypothetical protein SPJ07_04075 [Bacilli bacterium]|nr:hypothetical protein [Bacilli bacterium]
MQKISVKTIYLILVISIGLVGLGVGSTFAMFTASSKIDNPISFTAGIFGESDVIETVEVTVPAGETKATNLHVTNSTNSNLNYVMWYIDEGLDIELGSKRTDSGTYQTTIGAGEEHQYEVSIRNNSNSDVTVVIGVSSGTGSVTLSSDMKMVPQNQLLTKISKIITDLYLNNKNKVVTDGSVQYQYATSVNLMNDRLGGTTASLDGGNIRYYGASPNNYIDVGDRASDNSVILYRIIGVFDDKVKVIRNDSIGAYSWSNGSASEWTQASIMKLLNPGYTSETVGGSLWWNSESGNCYYATPGNYDLKAISCDFTSKGLSSSVQGKIADVTWHYGAYDGMPTLTPAEMYVYEQGTDTITDASVTRTSSWNGKVALMSASDYGYAADRSQCTSTLYDYGDCTSVNYLYISGINKEQWLLNPLKAGNTKDGAYDIYSEGSLILRAENGYREIFNGLEIRPSFYLKSSVGYVSGDGSQSNPYVIG